jgi:4-amino-4-deoxy-L-arabinose transferase-like glycosyltransferase
VSGRINRRDLPWVVLISVSFIFGLFVSWERWGNPLVDCGREMNQALRLARGEMLYSDVRHIYGPLSPYLNAALYLAFGPSLGVLYANGILTALLIIGLVYWLSRQFMGRAPSAAAALSVMWICAFKQAGNYVLPYSYAALHGCALGLASLALVVKAIQSLDGAADRMGTTKGGKGVSRYLFWGGLVAGLAVLAKTEMGFAAVSTGAVAAGLIHYPHLKRASAAIALFLSSALVLVGVVYGSIAAVVGWHALLQESFLFLQNLPPELVYFNRRMSGIDQPLLSLAQMAGSVLRIVSFALALASISMLVSRWRRKRIVTEVPMGDRSLPDAGRTTYALLWTMLAVSILVFAVAPAAGRLQWDKGPYLAMPVLLVALLVSMFIRYQRQILTSNESRVKTILLLALIVYALFSIVRVILRVRSGGAYSSYLLPASVILFTYGWLTVFPGLIKERRARPIARKIVLGLIFTWVAVTAGVVTHRFRTNNTYPVKTTRGTIIAIPELGIAFDEAIQFINRETGPADPVAVVPEGTSLNFFTDRPNPLREEITTPGYLNAEQEERAINQLIESNTRLILVTNRATPEFGRGIFGKDYCERLMQWIDENFEQHAMFGPDHDPNLRIGGRTFFIRAYRRKASFERL